MRKNIVCSICAKNLSLISNPRKKTCSIECGMKYKAGYQKSYMDNHPRTSDFKARIKKYNQRPEVRARKKELNAIISALYPRYFIEKNQGESFKQFKKRMTL